MINPENSPQSRGKSLNVTYVPYSLEDRSCTNCNKSHPYGVIEIYHRGEALEKELSKVIEYLRYNKSDIPLSLEKWDRMEQLMTYERKIHKYKVVASICGEEISSKEIQEALDTQKIGE